MTARLFALHRISELTPKFKPIPDLGSRARVRQGGWRRAAARTASKKGTGRQRQGVGHSGPVFRPHSCLEPARFTRYQTAWASLGSSSVESTKIKARLSPQRRRHEWKRPQIEERPTSAAVSSLPAQHRYNRPLGGGPHAKTVPQLQLSCALSAVPGCALTRAAQSAPPVRRRGRGTRASIRGRLQKAQLHGHLPMFSLVAKSVPSALGR